MKGLQHMEQLFKSIGIIDPSNFVAITKLSHLEILLT